MSSSSNSSSGTSAKSPSPLPRRSNVRNVAAALAAAAAFFALPVSLAWAFGGGGWWYLLLAANGLCLLGVAIWRWAPLTTLGASVLTLACAALALLGTAMADTCGNSNVAGAVEWSGAALLVLGVGTWGVLGERKFIWRFPLAWLAAALWVVAWAHVIPGGAGGCFH